MISARDFVLSYSEWFSFIAERWGDEAVEELWEAISDNFLTHFRKLIAEKGFDGMVEHWARTLEEEQADCDITVEDGRFQIIMHKCPSVGMLRNAKHIQRYPRYCRHCKVLYGRVMSDYGFQLEIDYIDEDRGVCVLIVRKTDMSSGSCQVQADRPGNGGCTCW